MLVGRVIEVAVVAVLSNAVVIILSIVLEIAIR